MQQREQRFVEAQRVGRLATADKQGRPHVVPVCFVLVDDTVYITIDEKPKSESPRPLKRLRNLLDNPETALVVDRYGEDWSRLGWVMLRGKADILAEGAEHDQAQACLRERYIQYRDMRLDALPVIAIRVERVTSWGNLNVCPPP